MISHRASIALLCSLGIGGWSGAAPASADAQSIHPDSLIRADGIGPVRLAMSEVDLVELLGPEAVQRTGIYLGEGFCAPGARLFTDTPAEIDVTYGDTARSTIVNLAVGAEDAPWRTPAGVHIGSTLKDLEAIAGKVVEFAGFDWDYSGWARWTEPGLEAGVRLGATQESEGGVADDPRYVELLGDRIVRSDHPVVRKLTILVHQIAIGGGVPPDAVYECPQGPGGSW